MILYHRVHGRLKGNLRKLGFLVYYRTHFSKCVFHVSAVLITQTSVHQRDTTLVRSA